MNAATDNTTDLEMLEVPSMNSEIFSEIVAEPDHGGPVVTLMIPMEKKGKETRKNPIRFKNALSEARDRLKEAGKKDDALTCELDAFAKLDDPAHEFWQQQDHGLAVVADRDRVRAWKLPFRPIERVHLGTRPALGELLRLRSGMRVRFLVLDLNETRLFEADGRQVEALDLGDAPASLDEAMRFDDPEKSLQFRAAPAPSKGAGGNAMYHGHGVTSDDNRKRKIQRFFEMIDAELSPRLADDGTPLVLFGPAMECGLFREVNSYAGLEEDEIHFNPSELGVDELHQRLQQEVAERAARSHSRRIEDFEHALGVGQGSIKPEELLGATVEAKLATVVIARDMAVWGSFDSRTGKSTVHDSRQPGDIDLLETLATAAFLQGAEVIHLDQEGQTLPEGASAAGIYRY